MNTSVFNGKKEKFLPEVNRLVKAVHLEYIASLDSSNWNVQDINAECNAEDNTISEKRFPYFLMQVNHPLPTHPLPTHQSIQSLHQHTNTSLYKPKQSDPLSMIYGHTLPMPQYNLCKPFTNTLEQLRQLCLMKLIQLQLAIEAQCLN